MTAVPFGIDELVVSFVPLADIMHVRVNRRFAELAVQCAEHALCTMKCIHRPLLEKLLKVRELCPLLMQIDEAYVTVALNPRYEYCMEYASVDAQNSIIMLAARRNNIGLVKKYLHALIECDIFYIYNHSYAAMLPRLHVFKMERFIARVYAACRANDLRSMKKCVRMFTLYARMNDKITQAVATACDVFGEAVIVEMILKYRGGLSIVMLAGHRFKNIELLRRVLAVGGMVGRYAFSFINRNYEMVTKIMTVGGHASRLVWQYVLCARSDDDVRAAIGSRTYQIPDDYEYAGVIAARVTRCMRDKN